MSQFDRDGPLTKVVETVGSLAGCANGPDGALYVCNGGGTQLRSRDGLLEPDGPTLDCALATVERVDMASGNVNILYDQCAGRPLGSSNDLVFDACEGFYFTNFGRIYPRYRERGSVYYALVDGSAIREVIHPLGARNGVGLSPDGHRQYIAETVPGRLWSFDILETGRVDMRDDRYARGALVAGPPGLQCLDSLAVQADG